MVCAETIANYLIKLASEEVEFEPMTHLRLQKLLYYIQGWSLALRGNPAFAEEIQAWREGPVVPPVYQLFKAFDARAIGIGDISAEKSALGAELESFVRSIWESYKKFSAIELRHKTHAESPWLEARGEARPTEPSTDEITHDMMCRYFTDQFERNQFGDLSIERYQRSERAFLTKSGKRFAEIRSR